MSSPSFDFAVEATATALLLLRGLAAAIAEGLEASAWVVLARYFGSSGLDWFGTSLRQALRVVGSELVSVEAAFSGSVGPADCRGRRVEKSRFSD